MVTPVLSVVSVNKHFGGLAAVKDLSLDVQVGEFIGLMGPRWYASALLWSYLATSKFKVNT